MPLGKSPMTLWLPGLNSPTLSPFQSPPSSNQEISPLSALPTRLPAPLPPSWPHRFQFLLPIAPKRQPGHFFKILLRTGSSSVQTPGGSFLFNLIKSTSQPGTPAVSCPGSPLPASASGLTFGAPGRVRMGLVTRSQVRSTRASDLEVPGLREGQLCL